MNMVTNNHSILQYDVILKMMNTLENLSVISFLVLSWLLLGWLPQLYCTGILVL